MHLTFAVGKMTDQGFTPGQWKIVVEVPEGTTLGGGEIPCLTYEASNPDPLGGRRFYTMEMGPYGNPMAVESPDNWVPIPEALHLVDPRGQPVGTESISDPRIVGFVFLTEDGKTAMNEGKALRFSFDNPDAPGVKENLEEFAATGGITIGGRKFQLVGLHAANKNRLKGLVAFFMDASSDAVIVSELADTGTFMYPFRR